MIEGESGPPFLDASEIQATQDDIESKDITPFDVKILSFTGELPVEKKREVPDKFEWGKDKNPGKPYVTTPYPLPVEKEESKPLDQTPVEKSPKSSGAQVGILSRLWKFLRRSS